MPGPFFIKHREQVRSALGLGESADDVETMCSIIVQARRERRFLGEEDERIALWSLCFLGIPIKAARYADEVKRFRRRFIGISIEASLQNEFLGTLRRPLLEADKVEHLVAGKLSDLFEDKAGGHEPFDPGTRGGKTGPGTPLEEWPKMFEVEESAGQRATANVHSQSATLEI